MSINLSYRKTNGQFVRHSALLNSFAIRALELVAVAALSKVAEVSFNSAVVYLEKRKQAKAQAQAQKVA